MIINLHNAQGVQKLWKQERIIVRAELQPILFWTDLHGSQQAPLARYENTGNYADIDVTDYVRTYPNVSVLYFADGGAADDVIISLSVQVVGLINPASVIIPAHPTTADIVPPSLIYLPDDQRLLNLIEFEIYAASGLWALGGDASISSNERSIGQISGAFTIQHNSSTKKYTPRPIPCGLSVIVQWVSFTGITRCAMIPAIKQTISAADGFSLLTIDNSYNEVKGRVDGLSLRLDGLCAYDVWYYSDMITSSKVQISLDGNEWTQVQVTDSSITIPDGEALQDGKLEIKVNYKRYDAVNM